MNDDLISFSLRLSDKLLLLGISLIPVALSLFLHLEDFGSLLLGDLLILFCDLDLLFLKLLVELYDLIFSSLDLFLFLSLDLIGIVHHVLDFLSLSDELISLCHCFGIFLLDLGCELFCLLLGLFVDLLLFYSCLFDKGIVFLLGFLLGLLHHRVRFLAESVTLVTCLDYLVTDSLNRSLQSFLLGKSLLLECREFFIQLLSLGLKLLLHCLIVALELIHSLEDPLLLFGTLSLSAGDILSLLLFKDFLCFSRSLIIITL